jgi:hypothetical protein
MSHSQASVNGLGEVAAKVEEEEEEQGEEGEQTA